DSMTILRDGRTIGRYAVKDIEPRRAVSLMAGRDITSVFPVKEPIAVERPALEVTDVRLRRGQTGWSLSLNHGEILGLGGLQGQGQRDFLLWLYGAGPGSGSVARDNRAVKIRRPGDALKNGIVLIPEDRALEGLHLNLPVRWNLAMATLRKRSHVGVLALGREKSFAAAVVKQMAIRLTSLFQPVSSLSGGTQQKVVIGKFMAVDPAVLLFVDSTRGIDVQTKFEFYEMLRNLAKAGAACVVYSSDTEELVGLCDRVAVFHDGSPVRMLDGEEVTQDAVVLASFAAVEEVA
ncbi:MAG TPA: ATP-binding cassette domain-containing protein, partial [Solirubrobacteraceae bacterium]|nr:ATP-binding cassette domain-containing protein [Solirubrobacteraceae bacterium]